MGKHQQESTPWEDCQGGELQQMVDRQLQKQRSRRIANLAGGTAVLLGCVLVGWMLGSFFDHSSSGQFDHGGLLCHEVGPLLNDYQAGTLDDQRAQQVKAHLEQCDHCREAYRKMYGSVQTTATLLAFERQHFGGRASTH